MGIYVATTTALATRMVGVSFDTATSALAVEMIADAEAEVNKYLSKRYDLASAAFQTSTSVPPLVRALTTKLSEAYMWRAISRGGKESLARAKAIEDPVLENLKSIAAYQMDLVNTTGSVITDMSNTAYQVRCNTDGYTPTFAEDDELNWQVDQTKLDDIDSERG